MSAKRAIGTSGCLFLLLLALGQLGAVGGVVTELATVVALHVLETRARSSFASAAATTSLASVVGSVAREVVLHLIHLILHCVELTLESRHLRLGRLQHGLQLIDLRGRTRIRASAEDAALRAWFELVCASQHIDFLMRFHAGSSSEV